MAPYGDFEDVFAEPMSPELKPSGYAAATRAPDEHFTELDSEVLREFDRYIFGTGRSNKMPTQNIVVSHLTFPNI